MKRKPPKSNSELIHKVKELEKEIKLKDKIIEEERTKVEILKNPCTSLCNPKAKCAAIHEKKTEYRISEMCKALGISNCTYYKWVKRKEYKIRKIMRGNGLYSEIVKRFKPYANKKLDGKYCDNKLNQNIMFHSDSSKSYNKIAGSEVLIIIHVLKDFSQY